MDLEIKNLAFEYVAKKRVFSNVSFVLEKGDVLSILGSNGAGKSTLLNCVAGLYHPCEGDIMLDGQSVFGMSRNETARHIGYVPQIHNPGFAFSVLEFTVMGRTPYIGTFSRPSREDYDIARRSLERMGIAHLENKVFTEMSGGEQQMVMLARVLTQEPEIILFDEPTNHLDYGNQYRTIDMIRSLTHEGYTVLITTHNPDHALMLEGKVAILDREGHLSVGISADQLTSKTLTELYNIAIGVEYNENAGRNLCFVKR